MKVRIISRPIAPPWDSGSMNMAYGISIHLNKHHCTPHLPTLPGFHPLADHIIAEAIYTSRTFNFSQKVRLIRYLLMTPTADITHFFLGLSQLTAAILTLIIKIKRMKSVLTLTHVPKVGYKPAVIGQRVVTYSAYSAQLLEQAGFDHITHIPPGVDVQAIHPGLDGTEMGNKLGIPSDVPVVLYAGELGHSATVETLLEAIPLCLANKPKMYFVLASRIRNDYQQKRKKALVQRLQQVSWGQNVIVKEQISNMHSLIARSTICILPLYNTHGKVDIPLFLLEAMSMAKPIVITDIAPLNELLVDPTGLAVPVDDTIALAGAIEQMLVAGKEYGICGRQVVERQYSLHQIALQYERLYMELLDERYSRLL